MTQTPLQRFLMERFRNNPIDRNEHPAVARLRWRQIRAAYAHLVDRANAWDDQKPAPEQLSIAEDVSGLYGPPIVHPAGAIPSEAEQAVAERIVLRRAVAKISAQLRTNPHGPVEVTSEEWQALKNVCPPKRQGYLSGSEIGSLTGVSIKVVLSCGCQQWEHDLYNGVCPPVAARPDPTPKPGWLQRAIRRLFG